MRKRRGFCGPAGSCCSPGSLRAAAALEACPLLLARLDDITANVVASLRLDEARKRALIKRAVWAPLCSFATGAYAMEGTAMRRALEGGETAYVAAVLVKAPAGPPSA